MSYGFSEPLANAWLDTLSTKVGGIGSDDPQVRIHATDPGPGGTDGISAGDGTRHPVTFIPAATGAITLDPGTLAPQFTHGGPSPETITHITLWDGPAGTMMLSGVVGTPTTWQPTNTFTLVGLGISLGPLAA